MDRKPIILISLLLISGCIDAQEEKEFTITKADKVFIIFFYMQECDDCAEVEMWLEELQQEYGSKISIRHVDVLEKEGWGEFKGYGFSITPAVVINEEITLQFTDITKERLSELVEEILS